MEAALQRPWLRAALLAGVGYFVIGRGFTWPTTHVQLWRLAAWAASGAVFVAHFTYEHFRLRHSPRRLAWHTAAGVALGAFGLAIAGMLHSLQAGAALWPAWLLALVAWPALTAVPAFLVALVAGTVLARLPRRSDAG